MPPTDRSHPHESGEDATAHALNSQAAIRAFLAGSPHAVVGASRDRTKYGNKVLCLYQQRGRAVYPVNPAGGDIEGLAAYPSLSALPEPVHGVSIITPPPITRRVVDEAIGLGIRHLWMQPGAEDDQAIAAARAAGLNVIAGGPCILVVEGYREHP